MSFLLEQSCRLLRNISVQATSLNQRKEPGCCQPSNRLPQILEMMQPFNRFDEFELFDGGQNLVELRHVADVDDKSTGGYHICEWGHIFTLDNSTKSSLQVNKNNPNISANVNNKDLITLSM
jgi:hypothetical protein